MIERDLAEMVFRLRTAVDERGRNDCETVVDRVGLADVEDKLGIFDDVHPEPQRQTDHHIPHHTQYTHCHIPTPSHSASFVTSQ